MATKRPTVTDTRAVIAQQAIGVDEIAERHSRSIYTVISWTYGRVNLGSPAFPQPVKRIGKARVWCADEVADWIAKHGGTDRT